MPRWCGEGVSFVAFYADCRHEVRPVRTGNRIVLTYNLMLKSDTAASASEPPSATVDDVADQAAVEPHQSPLGWLAVALIFAAFAQLIARGVAMRAELDTLI